MTDPGAYGPQAGAPASQAASAPSAGSAARALRVLVVTAVAPERDAVAAAFGPREDSTGEGSATEESAAEGGGGPDGHGVIRTPLPAGSSPGARPLVVDAVAAGVGPAAAASCAATALTRAEAAGAPYGLVVSAGIGGGFGVLGDPAAPVRTVVATRIVAADLGAQLPSGFAPVTELGFGTTEFESPPALVRALSEATGAASGPVLTVSTVTGTAERAAELAARHEGVAAEAMEGFGVAEAASAHGVPVLEIRTVSNLVGPRDRDAWRVPEALAALRTACSGLVTALGPWEPWRT